MSESARMKISFAALLGWMLPTAVLVGAAWAYPAWRLGGRAGLQVELSAGLIVLVVKLVSGGVVVRAARRGPARAAFAFVVLSMARVAAAAALAAGVWQIWSLPAHLLLIWIVIFYLALLAAEGAWLARALKHDAFRVALGEMDRRRRF